jgi:lipopolysaccharide cholinephosphotransferase
MGDNPEKADPFAELADVHRVFLKMLEEIDAVCRRHNIEYSLAAGTVLGAERHGGFIPWDDDLDLMIMRREVDRFIESCEKELDPRRYRVLRPLDPSANPYPFIKIEAVGTRVAHRLSGLHQYFDGLTLDVFPIYNVPNSAAPDFLQWTAAKVVMLGSHKLAGWRSSSRLKRILVALVPRRQAGRIQRAALGWIDRHEPSASGRLRDPFTPTSRQRMTFERAWVLPFRQHPFEGRLYPSVADPPGYLTARYGSYLQPPHQEERRTHLHSLKHDARNWLSSE